MATGTATNSHSRGALVLWLLIGTILQLAMVIIGHYEEGVAQLFAVGGVTISLIAGAGYGASKPGSFGRALRGATIVGGGCALIGIGVSCGLGDVEPIVLTFGTASSAVTGLIGGLVAWVIVGRRGPTHVTA